MLTKKEFLKKYPKPLKCPIPKKEWATSLGYCWAYATTIDEGKKWDNKRCPCSFFDLTQSK